MTTTTTFSQQNMMTFLQMRMTFAYEEPPIRRNFTITNRSNNETNQSLYPFSVTTREIENERSRTIQDYYDTAAPTSPFHTSQSTIDDGSYVARPRRRPSKSITLLDINLSRLNVIDGLFDYIIETMDAVIEFFAMTSVSTMVVYQLSVPALLIHSVIVYLSRFISTIQQNNIVIDLSGTIPNSNITIFEDPSSTLPFDWKLPLHVLFVWIFPILFTASGLSFTAALRWQWPPNEASVFAGLIALFLMDFIVPLAISCCVLFYFLWNFSAPNTLALIVSVWLVCFCGATIIRWLLYPRLGYD